MVYHNHTFPLVHPTEGIFLVRIKGFYIRNTYESLSPLTVKKIYEMGFLTRYALI